MGILKNLLLIELSRIQTHSYCMSVEISLSVNSYSNKEEMKFRLPHFFILANKICFLALIKGTNSSKRLGRPSKYGTNIKTSLAVSSQATGGFEISSCRYGECQESRNVLQRMLSSKCPLCDKP